MDPLTIALLAGSIGSGLLGGFMGNSAQKSANKTNLQIARETNAANTQNYQDYISALYNINSEGNVNQRWLQQNQQAYNALETQKQREWDSAASQVRRLMEAGVNPASVQSAGGGETAASSGLGTAVANAPSVPHPNVLAQVQPVNAMSNSLSSIGNLLSTTAISSASNISKEKIAKGEQAVQLKKIETEEDIAARDRMQKAFDEAAKLSFSREGLKEQKRLNDSLIRSAEVANKAIEEGSYYEKEQIRLRNEELLVSKFRAESERNVSDAQVRLMGAQTNDIEYVLKEIEPWKRNQIILECGKIVEDINHLKNENEFNSATLNARINEAINKAGLTNTQRLLLNRAFNNLTDLDSKQWIQVFNSILTVFGGSGLTPGYKVGN